MQNSSPPPLSITWSGAPRQRLALDFEFEQPLSSEQLADLQRLMNVFAGVGAHGGFARIHAEPAQSSMRMAQPNFSEPTRPSFLLETEQVDVRAFQLLRNSLSRWSENNQAIREVRIIDRTSQVPSQSVELAEPTWTTEILAYPPQSEQMQIRVEHGDPGDYQKERRCVVEFGRRVPNEVFTTAAEPIAAWAALLYEGSYAHPIRPATEAAAWLENLGPYDEYSMEVAFSLFEASEASWYTLMNCLQRYSAVTEPIVLVTID